MSLENAVAYAVDECIKEGILADFLRKNKAEVISMSVYEYDEKLHEKTLIEIGREEGSMAKLISQVCCKLAKGKDVLTIADELEEDTELIEKICTIAQTQAPDYDKHKILEQMRTIVA